MQVFSSKSWWPFSHSWGARAPTAPPGTPMVKVSGQTALEMSRQWCPRLKMHAFFTNFWAFIRQNNCYWKLAIKWLQKSQEHLSFWYFLMTEVMNLFMKCHHKSFNFKNHFTVLNFALFNIVGNVRLWCVQQSPFWICIVIFFVINVFFVPTVCFWQNYDILYSAVLLTNFCNWNSDFRIAR